MAGAGAGAAGTVAASCIFCDIARKSTSASLLHALGIRTIFPLPIEFCNCRMTRLRLFRTSIHRLSVSHMLDVGKTLLLRDAPQAKHHRFGFHQPPLNSVNHLHLHCLALPYTPRWRCMKYLSLGSLGFIEADKLLEKIKPVLAVP